MCFGAAVHFAPVGAAGMSIFHVSGFGTNIVNASVLPSGDQLRSEIGSLTRVTCDVAPSASMYRTKSWVPLGSPSFRNAMRVPSGDQRGLAPLVRKRLRDPSAAMIQRLASQRSSSL